MNLDEAGLHLVDGGAEIALGSQTIFVPDEVLGRHDGIRARDGGRIIVGIRPENMDDASTVPGHPANQRLRSTASLIEALGADILVHFEIDATPVDSGDPDAVEEVGDRARSVARFDPRSRARLREPIEIAVDVDRIRFFDPDTHLAL